MAAANPAAAAAAAAAAGEHEDPFARCAFLLGSWSGGGDGFYPTIKSFRYNEIVTFERVGKHVMYTQHSQHPTKHKPMHSEAGIWRFLPQGVVEFVVGHVTGMTEISEGEVSQDSKGRTIITLVSKEIGRSTSAWKVPPQVSKVMRVFTYDPQSDVLSYELSMATSRTPEMTPHLVCRLRRVDGRNVRL